MKTIYRLTFILTVMLFFFLNIKMLEGVASTHGLGYHIEMLEWDQVNKQLPKFSKFHVLDTESGRMFEVQRRAGSQHADVQPLTAKDTKIMKEIYDGQWSWRRRSIIVITKDRWIAASMHGMPHGAGALPNNFPGHFCIHFYGSTTHRTNEMDLSHKLMIFKASGRLYPYLTFADAKEVINSYITGLKEHDEQIAEFISLQKTNWNKLFPKIENAKVSSVQLPDEIHDQSELVLEVPTKIEWYVKNHGRQVFTGKIVLVRFSPAGPWKVNSVQFLEDHNHFNGNIN
ncbi:hypothetical protein [Cytobacillus gottheilii]|uniref:hypothetical protein n=1 Tax=Cytobacillus gottheilii TaxID=859144 RepID=UPI0009BA8706|nr:hypothetical protein [Cytobacillus gottheilii]